MHDRPGERRSSLGRSPFSTGKGPSLQSKSITQAPKKDIGVTVVVRHDTVPEQSDIKIPDRPKTQRERYNVRDVPSGTWPVFVDRGIKAESCTNRPKTGVETGFQPTLRGNAIAANQSSITLVEKADRYTQLLPNMSTIVDGLRSCGVGSRVEAVSNRLPIGCDDFICYKPLRNFRVWVVDIRKSSVPNPDAKGCGSMLFDGDV